MLKRMPYKRVYFIRHGQSEANAAKRDTLLVRDALLTDLGKQQASAWHQPNELSKVFNDNPPELCICSPLRRAMETAALVFKNQPRIPIESSRLPRERWWKHYQCIGSDHEETLRFAATLPRKIQKLAELTDVDKFWNPLLELEEANSLHRDAQGDAKDLYSPSKREEVAQGMKQTVEMLRRRPELSIAVACHWGVINALTDVSPNNCNIVAADLDVNTGEFLVLQEFAPPGEIEATI